MREILFRGKRIDNDEWVYGSLVIWSDGSTSIFDARLDVPTWAVDPTTVSQFTGLTDKNGKRIFEGDIVRYMNNDIMVIVWNKEAASFVGAYSYINFNYCATLINGHMYLEVIGNIHDNPELLEVQ